MTHPVEFDAANYAYSGPCVRCGHLPDEHGERGECLRVGCHGDHYAPGHPIPSATGGAA